MKVLVFGMTENPGGVESFLMNYYRCIDREKIQFDFLCNSYQPIAYEQEIHQLGGKTYHISSRSKNFLKYRKEMKSFFELHKGEYQAIWVNVCSLANIDYLKMAKKYGIPRRIIHSHNSQNMDGRLRKILHDINKHKIDQFATDFWACSQGAAEWFYGKKAAEIIHNAINVDQMSYDESKRKTCRIQLGWDDNYVIGNIGRFHFQKNQLFLLDVFYELLQKIPEARLILIGQGEDEKRIKEKIHVLGLDGKVGMPGVQKDISGWLSAMDIFLFPSVFEGLSVVALEAQANGIPILASTLAISKEAKINNNVVLLELDRSAKDWSQIICKIKKELQREQNEKIKMVFKKNHYDICAEVQKLEMLLEG